VKDNSGGGAQRHAKCSDQGFKCFATPSLYHEIASQIIFLNFEAAD